MSPSHNASCEKRILASTYSLGYVQANSPHVKYKTPCLQFYGSCWPLESLENGMIICELSMNRSGCKSWLPYSREQPLENHQRPKDLKNLTLGRAFWMYLRMIPAFVHSILPMGFLDMGNAYDKIKTLRLPNKIPYWACEGERRFPVPWSIQKDCKKSHRITAAMQKHWTCLRGVRWIFSYW